MLGQFICFLLFSLFSLFGLFYVFFPFYTYKKNSTLFSKVYLEHTLTTYTYTCMLVFVLLKSTPVVHTDSIVHFSSVIHKEIIDTMQLTEKMGVKTIAQAGIASKMIPYSVLGMESSSLYGTMKEVLVRSGVDSELFRFIKQCGLIPKMVDAPKSGNITAFSYPVINDLQFPDGVDLNDKARFRFAKHLVYTHQFLNHFPKEYEFLFKVFFKDEKYSGMLVYDEEQDRKVTLGEIAQKSKKEDLSIPKWPFSFTFSISDGSLMLRNLDTVPDGSESNYVLQNNRNLVFDVDGLPKRGRGFDFQSDNEVSIDVKCLKLDYNRCLNESSSDYEIDKNLKRIAKMHTNKNLCIDFTPAISVKSQFFSNLDPQDYQQFLLNKINRNLVGFSSLVDPLKK